MATGKYQAKKRKRRLNPAFIVILLILIALLMTIPLIFITGCSILADRLGSLKPTSAESSAATTDTEQSQSHPATESTTLPAPTEPYITSTASVGVTGDVMGHMPVINAGKTANGYDYTDVYTYIKPYYESFDFMIANLEVNLGGEEAGPYQGYPTFNSPDEMALALKQAGVDMVLTANNHSYDIGHKSFIRTQTVLDEMELPHLGTVQNETTPLYVVQNINGIKVGMVCYTYETGDPANEKKQLNGINMSVTDSNLIGSFNYNDLESFYTEVEDALNAMYAEGAQATMVFIHWGDEYALTPNNNQKTIAQALCDLGVDVIVGGHPHVIEPFAVLKSETGNTTYCIYSVGNAISNQRTETLANTTKNSPYTEDGMIFSVEFQMWNDGTVEISEINILPTWVNKEAKGGKITYSIIPLDMAVESWTGYDVGNINNTYKSYNRTMSIVGEGLNVCREALGLPPAAITADTE